MPNRRRKPAIPVAARGIASSSLLPVSSQERFLDAAVTTAGGATAAALLLSRPAGDDLLWAFTTGIIAALAAVEGKGELHNFAAGYLGGDAGYLLARAAQREILPTAAHYAALAGQQAEGVHAALGIA